MLETRVYDRSKEFHTLKACPCGYGFDSDERRWQHFLQDHSPEDFGLSPLGELSDAASGPLFDAVPPHPDPNAVEPVTVDRTSTPR